MREARERHRNEQREQKHGTEVTQPEQNYDNNAREQRSVPPPGRNFQHIEDSQYVHYSGSADKSRPIVSRSARYIGPGGFDDVGE
ncbi:MAG: hypothetical protein WBY73_05705, partial [Candidatus Acidiferrales bacterium]